MIWLLVLKALFFFFTYSLRVVLSPRNAQPTGSASTCSKCEKFVEPDQPERSLKDHNLGGLRIEGPGARGYGGAVPVSVNSPPAAEQPREVNGN